MPAAISIPDLIKRLPGPWQPLEVVRANESIVRLARLEGEFPWHVHEEDELFLCWEGAFTVELEGGERVDLEAGDVFVVPNGVRHRPVAPKTAHALLLERPETRQYGNEESGVYA